MTEPTLALCTTLRAPLDQTLRFVRYHLNIGADHLYLFFDDPNDPAMAALKDNSRITAWACDASHWIRLSDKTRDQLTVIEIQKLNSTVALKQARQAGWDWIAHIDSDELIYCPGGVKAQIANAPASAQAIKLVSMESVPSDENTDSTSANPAVFKVWYPTRPGKQQGRGYFQLSLREVFLYARQKTLFRLKIQLAKQLGCKEPFQFSYLKGHVAGKSIVRVDSPAIILDCHYPIVNEPMRWWLFSGMAVLHYDAPAYKAWHQKWLSRHEGGAKIITAQEMRKERLAQYRAFVQAHESGNEDELHNLYRRMFLISANNQRILSRLGLLTQIQFPEKIFSD
jgi:hypothetical protein